MSDYVVPLKISCDMPGCKARATVEAFNKFNASVGRFCRKHGAEKIRRNKVGPKGAPPR